MMEKYIKDGKVAVIISPGFGAGWYSWNRSHRECLYHPQIVQLILDGKRDEAEALAEKLWPDGYWSAGQLKVEWLDPGTLFIVNEYDGAESMEINNSNYWEVA